ncbi:hypothetical protein APR51_01405 [Variovorax paradoxus]|nr:hypothetical protein APR52_07875 [Variovorax paradoxus]KPV25328.1 hypothetical protein APR51_01405 [Variovorax paradoxus]MBS74315.1 hypothetical protein [Variovorax sp.]
MFEANVPRIDLELLRDQQREGGVDPLAHLHARHHQRDEAVGADADHGVGREGLGPAGLFVPASSARE